MPATMPRVPGADDGQHEQADELDRRDAEVAAAGVDAERPALEPVRVEGVDVRHRGGEVAAADAGERGERSAASCTRRRARAGTRRATAGTSSSAALKIVQLRPPNRATANVYGSRSTAPTSAGTAVSRNLPAGSMPYAGPRNSTSTDHSVHTEKPMCSEKIEKIRLRRAIRRAGVLPELRVLRPPVVDPVAADGGRGPGRRAGWRSCRVLRRHEVVVVVHADRVDGERRAGR